MVYCAILAGGIGNRMGGELPKQFLDISDKPIIIHTIESFLQVDMIDEIVVLCPNDWIEYTRDLLSKHITNTARIKVIEGGATRNDTLIKACDYIDSINDSGDNVIITHDAARPFVTKRIIEENIATAKQYGACSTYIGAVDTIAVSSDGKIIESVTDRSKMYQAQTPQTFVAKLLREILQKTSAKDLEGCTDAAGLAIACGIDVRIVQGDSANIKITYPIDLELAEAIYKNKRS